MIAMVMFVLMAAELFFFFFKVHFKGFKFVSFHIDAKILNKIMSRILSFVIVITQSTLLWSVLRGTGRASPLTYIDATSLYTDDKEHQAGQRIRLMLLS